MSRNSIRVYGLSLTSMGCEIVRFTTLKKLEEWAKARGLKQYFVTGPYEIPRPLTGTEKPRPRFKVGDEVIWLGWGKAEIVAVRHNPPYQPDYVVKDKSGHRAFRKKIAHEWDLRRWG